MIFGPIGLTVIFGPIGLTVAQKAMTFAPIWLTMTGGYDLLPNKPYYGWRILPSVTFSET